MNYYLFFFLCRSEKVNLVKPELLAASLRVDSLQDPSLNPMLKLHFDVPRVSINFVNHLTYGGKSKTSEEQLLRVHSGLKWFISGFVQKNFVNFVVCITLANG